MKTRELLRVLLISTGRTLYEEGDFFFDAESLAEAEKYLANIYALRKEKEKVLCHLGECVRYVIMFDTNEAAGDTYTSLIPSGRSPVGINWNNQWNKSHEMLMRLKEDESYDFIRGNDGFEKLLLWLGGTDNMK